MKTSPGHLADTRNQLHWASQLLSAAADAKLEKADDDSHSNLAWDESASQLNGRAGVALNVLEFALVNDGESFSLIGNTLEDGAKWLNERLHTEIEFRKYEMPEHPVASGRDFSPRMDHLQAIADWFSFGQTVLVDQGELRVWPHHFDLGFWQPGKVGGTSIGGGFSLGDQYYDQPYFYINPYGIDRPATLPALACGEWTSYWFGAVLTADEIGEDNAGQIARNFKDGAIQLCQSLFT